MNEVDNFESSVKRLEDIVAKLEAGDLTLAESIALYKEGSELSDSCRKALREAELTVTVNDEK